MNEMLDNINENGSLDITKNSNHSQPIIQKQSVFGKKKKKYRNCYKSKWANLKFFLQDKASLEASVNLLKTKTIDQFSAKCKEIYTKKIEIQLSAEKNRFLISQGINLSEGYEDQGSKIKVTAGLEGLPTDSIHPFLFLFREQNHLMLKLIEIIDKNPNKNKIKLLVPFLCHFFYENFYMESTEQEEIIYIIYLLLEKEIDKLITPSYQSFLDDSFISHFLKEIGSRYEIKNYIDIIVNDLICNLEETNNKFYFLDITQFPKNINIEEMYEVTQEGELKQRIGFVDKYPSSKASLSSSIKIISKIENQLFVNKNKSYGKTSTITMASKSIGFLVNILPRNTAIVITEKFFYDSLNQEKNEVVRQFILNQIKKLKTSRNPNLFDPFQLHEYLKKKKKIPIDSIELFYNGVKNVTEFIDALLTNLENDTFIPYSIKVICKFIYILMQKKFKNINKYELNNFVGRFLFDKLILPIISNPDRSDAGKKRIISVSTRKNLMNIYIVFKNLVKGNLFTTNQNLHLVAFNKYIIDNYYRINSIIEKMINVKIPEKLQKLSEEFYKDDEFVLDNSKRSEEQINYDYFKENPNDFMQHKSICFTINELNTIYEIVNENKNIFIEPGKPLEKIYDTLSTFISMVKKNTNQYFVIISDNYNEDAKNLLFHKDKKLPLGKAESEEEIIQNIHYCISYLIGNLEILPHWDWVIDDYKTLDTFQYINKYLDSYEEIYNYSTGSVPLNWYSLYIINNIKHIKPEDALNDYEKLYKNIEQQIREQIKKLSKLNEFLTVNMTTKFLLIDHKIKIFEEELENVKNTFVNIKSLQIIESKEIPVSLATVEEYNEKDIPIEGKETCTDIKNLVLRKETYMPNKIDKNERNSNKKKEEVPKNFCFFCYKISHFINKFTDYYKLIYDELKQISQNAYINKSFTEMSSETKAKKIINDYIGLIGNYLKDKKIFDPPIKNNINDDEETDFRTTINEELPKVNNEKDEQKQKDIPSLFGDISKHSILNYILKTLSIKLYDEPILKEDMELNQKCISLSWIKPENLSIKEDIYDEDIFSEITEHLQKLDELRTPEEMLNELRLAIKLINSLYIFMLDKKDSDNDSFTSVLLYTVIMAKPKRMIFNIKFIDLFFDEKNKKNDAYYNVTQAKECIQIIKMIKGRELNVKEEEFSKRCNEALEMEKINKKSLQLVKIASA